MKKLIVTALSLTLINLSIPVSAQVTSVSQLKDVSPTDWAYDPLRSYGGSGSLASSSSSDSSSSDSEAIWDLFCSWLGICLW